MSIDYLLSGNPNEVISWQGHSTTGGRAVHGSRRSIAHLEYTNQRAESQFKSRVQIIQSAYNEGVAASAGTHDKDAVYDCFIPGIDWFNAQHFFRECGWAAWYRFPPAFSAHIHMVSLGYKTPVGIYVPGQVSDYYEHKSGLVGHAPDTSWHPSNIDATIFDYDAWKEENGDDMPYTEEELYRIVRKGVRDETKGFREGSKNRDAKLREALKRRFNATDAQLDEIQAEVENDE